MAARNPDPFDLSTYQTEGPRLGGGDPPGTRRPVPASSTAVARGTPRRSSTPIPGMRGGRSTAATGRAREAYDYFVSQGWQPHQAAGIVGNLMGESGGGLNTAAVGDSGRAFGIAQWHPDRQAGLRRLARERGTNVTDFGTQLAYVNHELNTSERRAGQRLRQSRDIDSATAAFAGHYERPQGAPEYRSSGDPSRMAGWSSRVSHARGLVGGRSETPPVRQASSRLPSRETGGVIGEDAQSDPPSRRMQRWLRDNPHGARLLAEMRSPEERATLERMIEQQGFPSVVPQDSSAMGRVLRNGRANYNSLSGTIGADSYSDIITELAHRQQNMTSRDGSRRVGPIGRAVRSVQMVGRQGMDLLRNGDEGNYVTPGAQEYEAHGEIEDGLWNQFESESEALYRRNESLDLQRVANRRRPRIRSTGGSVGSVAGGIAGQALIPIPGVGGMIGSAVGGVAGNLVEGGFKSNNKLARLGAGMAVGGPVGAALSLLLGGNDDPTKLITAEDGNMSQGVNYRNGGRLYANGGEIGPTDPEELLRRVQASVAQARAARQPGRIQRFLMSAGEKVAADRAMQQDPTYLQEERSLENARASMRRGVTANAVQEANPGGVNLGSYRSLGQLRYANGGALEAQGVPIPGTEAIGQDAVQFNGPSHEQGGIPLPGMNAEVEGGETLDQVRGNHYVFSDKMKVPGTTLTFAEMHKRMVKAGASTEQVDQLASMQEKTRGGPAGTPQQGSPEQVPVNPNEEPAEMATGGFTPGPNPLFNRLLNNAPALIAGMDQITGNVTPVPVRHSRSITTPLEMSVPGIAGGTLDVGTSGASGASGVAGAVAGLAGKFGAEKLLPYAGDLINIGMGLMPRKIAKAQQASSRSARMASEGRINIQPAISKLMAAQRGANVGASANNKLAAHAATLQGISELEMNKQNEEARMRQSGLSQMQNVEAQNASLRSRRDEMQEIQNDARRQAIAAGAAGAARTRQAQTLEARQNQTQQDATRIATANLDADELARLGPEMLGRLGVTMPSDEAVQAAIESRRTARTAVPSTTGAVQATVTPTATQTVETPDGQVMEVEAGATPASAPAAGASYTVTRGDSLSKIARANNTTVEELLRLNPSITNRDRIEEGSALVLPARN